MSTLSFKSDLQSAAANALIDELSLERPLRRLRLH